MTPARWHALITSVSLVGLTPHVELLYADSPWGPVVCITRWVHHVDEEHEVSRTPEPVTAVYPLPLSLDEDAGARWLLWHVQQNLAHEAAEFFTVNGNRPFDPHAQPQVGGTWPGCGRPGGGQ